MRNVSAALVAATATLGLTTAIIPSYAAEPTIDHVVSANPENWTPNVNDGKVESMVQVGGRIIAVGKFTSVTASNGTSYTRNSIFAFNATTGAVDTTFVPNVGTKEVSEVVDAGDGTLYIGGLIATVNGTKANKVARIDATTGALPHHVQGAGHQRGDQRHAAGQRPALHRWLVHHGGRAAAHPAGGPEPRDGGPTPGPSTSPSPTRGTAARSASSTSTSATAGAPWSRSATSVTSTARVASRS